MPLPVFGQQLIDLFGGVPDFVDRYVVIQSVDNACQKMCIRDRSEPMALISAICSTDESDDNTAGFIIDELLCINFIS